MFSDNPNKNVINEVILRISLIIMIMITNRISPFHRKIQKEEMWMYQYPAVDSYVSYWLLYSIFIIYTYFIMSYGYRKTRNPFDIYKGLWGLSLALCSNTFITSILKIIIGKPRPDIYSRCFPDGKNTDLTQCPENILDSGYRSFPSGHTSSSFSAMVFLSLYLQRYLDMKKSGEQGFCYMLLLIPILTAAFIGISRTCDYHHHYSDIIGGCMLGTSIGYSCFKVYLSEKKTCSCA